MAEDNEWLRREWLDCGFMVLRDDAHMEDHDAINSWILDFLQKTEMTEEDKYIASCIYHSLNFDIPFKATESVRNDLLKTARMKIANPEWSRFVQR